MRLVLLIVILLFSGGCKITAVFVVCHHLDPQTDATSELRVDLTE